jgi:DNA-binding beta-propeller fold protein YncE
MLSLGRKSRVVSVTPDGSDLQVLIDGLEAMPDGVAIDPIGRHLFYTFMGTVRDGEDFWEPDGFIERANLDGSERIIIVPEGTFVTGKQIQCDAENGRLYWSDREGLRVMSCRVDGSDVTVLVQTGSTKEDRQDRRRHCVGVAVDPEGGFLYWTQKGKPKGNEGTILRAPLAIAPGTDPAQRNDIEVLFDGLPEPIDLEWDRERETLYWTDRGDPPNGNTLNRAKIRNGKAEDHEILLSGLQEGIGLAYDPKGRRIFVSDLKGSLWVMSLDRPGEGKVIYQGRGPLTGIAYLRG